MHERTPYGAAAGERPWISVVLPLRGGAGRIEETLDGIDAYCRESRLEREILLVDDGSADDGALHTAEESSRDRGRCRVLRHPERVGIGAAVRGGVLVSIGRQVLIVASGRATAIEGHRSLADLARDRDLDVVIGGAAGSGPLQSGYRRMLALPWRTLRPELVLLDRDRTRPILARMVVTGEAWAMELLFVCARFSLRVAEVALPAAASARKASVRDLLDVARVRWRFRQGGYNPEVAAPNPELPRPR